MMISAKYHIRRLKAEVSLRTVWKCPPGQLAFFVCFYLVPKIHNRASKQDADRPYNNTFRKFCGFFFFYLVGVENTVLILFYNKLDLSLLANNMKTCCQN